MKKLIYLSIVLFILIGCNQTAEENNEPSLSLNNKVHYIDVKYRDNDIDVSDFEQLDTNSSSWIKAAWYDKKNEYMIVNLDGINYHYCEMPNNTWSDFKKTESFGSHYHEYIKGNYDCRYNYLPNY